MWKMPAPEAQPVREGHLESRNSRMALCGSVKIQSNVPNIASLISSNRFSNGRIPVAEAVQDVLLVDTDEFIFGRLTCVLEGQL